MTAKKYRGQHPMIMECSPETKRIYYGHGERNDDTGSVRYINKQMTDVTDDAMRTVFARLYYLWREDHKDRQYQTRLADGRVLRIKISMYTDGEVDYSNGIPPEPKINESPKQHRDGTYDSERMPTM